MYTDARIKAALDMMVRGIEAPPVPLSEIQHKSSQPQPVLRSPSRDLRLVIATATVVLVVLAFTYPGFVQTVQARYVAALQAIGGWQPPPPAPKPVASALSSQTASLTVAQSRVPFTLVPPAGLPNDVTLVKIVTTPTGIYVKATRSWRVGSPAVAFIYHRTDGRSFIVMADRFDPRTGPPPKYIFQDKNRVAGGHIPLIRHENFAWRNANQVMAAVAGEGLSATEIEAIRAAMHGVALLPAERHTQLNSGTVTRLYHIPRP